MTSLRPATPEDAEAIERVRTAGWRTAYRGIVADAYLDAMHGDVARRRRRLVGRADDVIELVAVDGGQVVGWASGGPTRDGDGGDPAPGEIYSLYVAPGRWRGGLGRQLLGDVVEGLRRRGHHQVTLWVLEANQPARRFYEAMGFEADGATNVLDVGGLVSEVRYRRVLEA